MLRLIRKNWIILLILAVAAFCRLYRITDYAEFLGDQGRDVYIVRDFLKNGNLFFIGPQTSIGNMYLGPYYYYLFVAPGLLLSWFNPVGPAVLVALLGVATVYLIFRIASEWLNPPSGYIAALLYALSPTVIKYSSFSWNPNIMPLFSLLFIYFLTKKKYFLATLAFIICFNSHFLSLVLLPVALVVLWFNRPLPLKTFLLCLLLFIVSLTPQILFDIRHHGQNIDAIISFFTNRETTVNLKAYKSIPLLVPLFDQINTSLLAAKYKFLGYTVSAVYFLLMLWSLFKSLVSRRNNKYFVILLFWYLIGLVGLGLYKQHIYDHYFGFLFPAVFMLFGYLLSFLPKFFSFSIVLILIIALLSRNPFRYDPPRQIATTRSIDDLIVANSGGQPFNFALLAKMNYDPGYRYFLAENRAPVKLLPDQLTDQLFVVCEPFEINCQPINNPEWSVAAFGWARIDREWEINGIKIFRLVHTQS